MIQGRFEDLAGRCGKFPSDSREMKNASVGVLIMASRLACIIASLYFTLSSSIDGDDDLI